MFKMIELHYHKKGFETAEVIKTNDAANEIIEISLVNENNGSDVVYLLSILGEVFVSSDENVVYDTAQSWISLGDAYAEGVKQVFLFEFARYESAFEVALDIKKEYEN